MRWRRALIIKVLSGIYLIIFAFLAFYDPPLQPAVAEFFKVPVPSVPDADNGYYALLGFEAPSGTDIMEHGRARFQAIMADAAKKQKDGKQPAPRNDSVNKLTFKGKEPPKENWQRFVADSSADLDRYVNDNRELLERYQYLKKIHRFEEPFVTGHFQDIPIPAFAPIRNAQLLYLMQAVNLAHQGKVDEALVRLSSDLTYWQGTLHQSRTLIVKLISIAEIQRVYQALSDLIALNTLSAEQKNRIRSLLPPWKPEDIQFGESLRYEALFLSDSLFSLALHHGLLDGVLVKKNATRNIQAKVQMANVELTKLNAERFSHEIQLIRVKRRYDSRLKLDFLYNPVGTILLSIATPQFDNFILKGHDLEAKRRMVLSHLLAKERGVNDAGMAGFLKSAPKELCNPYTNEPMQWDEKKRIISVPSVTTSSGVEGKKVELAL